MASLYGKLFCPEVPRVDIDIKIWCLTHTDSTYKLEVGVENDKCIVKYLSIIANTSWGPWDTALKTFSEAVSIML